MPRSSPVYASSSPPVSRSNRRTPSGSAPRRRFASTGSAHTSWPSTIARPASGRSKPTAMDRVVVLPAPLGPSRPKNEPAGTSRSTPATAIFASNRLVRPRSESASRSITRPTVTGGVEAPPAWTVTRAPPGEGVTGSVKLAALAWRRVVSVHATCLCPWSCARRHGCGRWPADRRGSARDSGSGAAGLGRCRPGADWRGRTYPVWPSPGRSDGGGWGGAGLRCGAVTGTLRGRRAMSCSRRTRWRWHWP